MTLQLANFDSTNLDFAGYDPEERTLEVTFKNGRTYVHEGVPPVVWADLQSSFSPGKYYNAHIRDDYRLRR